MVFLQNVTLSVLNQKEYLENFGFGENFACVMTSDTYVESASWFGVSNIASTSFAFHGESPNSGWMGLVEHFLHMEYIPSYSNYSLGPTNSVEYLSAAYNATGYTNTANALHQAAAWASYFTAALGLALVVMDAANVCGIFCGLGDIAATTSALSAIAGFTTAFVSAISSISISVVDTLSIQAYSFTNDPHNNTWSSYNMFFEMATNSTTLSGVSGNYVANMPILLGIACPPGDYPGHGC